MVAALAVYVVYTEYNNSKAREYISQSQKHKTTANEYLNQAYNYDSNNDYANALIYYQKSSNEIAAALQSDKDAHPYASGVYLEYIDTDLLLLEKTAKLIEYKAYGANYKNNSLNPTQERVNPTVLEPFITNLNSEIATYQIQLEQIIAAHPNEFKFLQIT
jgi:hypothetical protein